MRASTYNTESFFGKTLEAHNNEINEAFLRDYCTHLEQKPVLDPCGWGWLGIFAQDLPMEFRAEMQERLDRFVNLDKPYGCVLCGDKPATKYHICAGRVCDTCFLTMPKE